MTLTAIQSAFRHHLQTQTAMAWGVKPGMMAKHCLTLARQDVAAGKARYPAPMTGHKMRAGHDSDKPGSVYIENPESFGLRLVGRVATEPGGRNGYFSNDGGWFDNPHGESSRDGDGLIYGLVYQMRGQNGQARFVAAYQNGCNDSGALFDFSTIYTASRDDSYWVANGDKDDIAGLREAARAADHMAEKAAESEREYRTAWRAGSDYEQEGETIAEARQEALAILSERRAVKGKGNYPALCAAIRSQVESLLETIAEARTKRADLANGDADGLYFWTGDKRLQDAFCEGASLDSFPA